MPQDTDATKPLLLWWGRSDVAYSRNAIIRQCFESLGWQIVDYHPRMSRLADWQAPLSRCAARMRRAALVWVPCFRQRDIAAARRYASRIATPLCIDPLISAYDKQVDERAKLVDESIGARRLKRWESALFARADWVIADTHEHAEFFARVLAVDPARIAVVPVGADESMFVPTPQPTSEGTIQILFYGSFLALQGPQVIVEASSLLQACNVQVTMLGDGPLHARCVADAAANTCVRFEPWIDYARLPARIAQAHLLLGVFGTTPKAERVIPNKVYQALASARAVVTRDSPAYPAQLRHEVQSGLRFVDAGSAHALAAAIHSFAENPQASVESGLCARQIYQQYFSNERVRYALSQLLTAMNLPAPNAQ